MKNINNRKLRQHHRLISMMREYAPNPLPLADIITRFANDPTATNLLVRPNAWAQYARKPCDDGVNEMADIVNSVRGTKDQTYTLVNAFAFTTEGRRIGNAEGTRLLTDDEILDLLTNGHEGETALGSNIETPDANNESSDAESSDETIPTETVTVPGVIDAVSLFADDDDDHPEVTDIIPADSFPMSDEPVTESYVAPAKPPVVRHIDPVTKRFCSKARAIELGFITAEAA